MKAVNSIDDIWQAILDILSRNMTPTAIKAWFSDCKPVEIEDSRLVIHTTTDFKRKIITERYGSVIRAALSDLFSEPDFELLVLAGDGGLYL